MSKKQKTKATITPVTQMFASNVWDIVMQRCVAELHKGEFKHVGMSFFKMMSQALLREAQPTQLDLMHGLALPRRCPPPVLDFVAGINIICTHWTTFTQPRGTRHAIPYR